METLSLSIFKKLCQFGWSWIDSTKDIKVNVYKKCNYDKTNLADILLLIQYREWFMHKISCEFALADKNTHCNNQLIMYLFNRFIRFNSYLNKLQNELAVYTQVNAQLWSKTEICICIQSFYFVLHICHFNNFNFKVMRLEIDVPYFDFSLTFLLAIDIHEVLTGSGKFIKSYLAKRNMRKV